MTDLKNEMIENIGLVGRHAARLNDWGQYWGQSSYTLVWASAERDEDVVSLERLTYDWVRR